MRHEIVLCVAPQGRRARESTRKADGVQSGLWPMGQHGQELTRLLDNDCAVNN